MAQAFFSGEEIDRMKADAVRRARQMHSRSSLPNSPINNFSGQNIQKKNEADASIKLGRKSYGINNLLHMTKMMGFENDQLILLALILILSGDEENLPIIIALIYIFM